MRDRRPVYGPPEPVRCDFMLYGHWCGVCLQGIDPAEWEIPGELGGSDRIVAPVVADELAPRELVARLEEMRRVGSW